MPSLLVIDDETSILHAFRRAFSRPDLQLLTATTGQEGFDAVVQHQPDVVLLDINLPDASGLDVFRRIHEHDARIPVIFITGHGTTETAIEAMKLGAFDYLLKPLELAPLEALVNRAFEISRLMRVPAQIQDESPQEGADIIIGRCAPMQEIYKSIGRIAPQHVTVLILGETGTGKELIARAIYQHSRRAAGPFLAVNCAAIPETLLESELFGYEKGAFTGADRRRIGKFEQCSGGTLFLDEIGDMSPLTQAKILRVLQDQQFERVGSNETIQADVRIIAATNRDLQRMISEDEFRSDLYYRLSVFTITLPPLRERGDDLILLIQYFLKRFGRELGKEVKEISPEALEILQSYSWPGNMRELQSVIKQALLHATGPLLLPDFLPPLTNKEASSVNAGTTGAYSELDRLIESELQADSPNLFETVINEVKRRLVTRALHQTGNNQVRAAKALGIARSTLRNELRSLGISVEKQINTLDDEPA
ncbi:MAG TPA: sigma-54 dependent transcriptional regulator [Planctomycetaceae bacterium]|nr:sigma-54 dependent transcriptional regulator [Planctomycetaceae bacterium]